jgi:murein DD-endopeptidase MepM/ murein hydrolase activator NlpD
LMLGGVSLSDFFNEAAALDAIRLNLRGKISTLSTLKDALQSSKDVAQQKRQELDALENNLAQQKQSLAVARATQADLLAQTKQTEVGYQKSLALKKAQEKKFEQDLSSFESQLNLKVSRASLPKSGTGSLAWPVDDPLITQYFGNTPFATANPQVYNGKGHNAIDLRATTGTPIKAARAGIILGTGNTDVTCPGASYGKWVFIQHDNGLSTLYAHLSVIKVSKGDHVDMGETVGLSGATGYATGPHLHFGVYASSGAEIASFPSKSCTGRTYTMPVGDISAYLNPLSYLPKI